MSQSNMKVIFLIEIIEKKTILQKGLWRRLWTTPLKNGVEI